MLIFQEKCELGCLRAIVLFNPDARGLDPNVSAQVTKQTLFCNNLQWGSVFSDMVNVYECYFEVGLVLSKKSYPQISNKKKSVTVIQQNKFYPN